MSTRVLLTAAILVTLSAASEAAQVGRWWQDPATQRNLRLSPAQTSAIERIYDSTLAERQALRARLDHEERALADALAEGTLSDADGQILITRVANLRRRRNVARMALLVRMYRVLTLEQRRNLRLADPAHH